MPNLIFIDGPPGVGKSTLASALAASLPSYKLLTEMDPAHPLHPAPVSEGGADFAEIADRSVDEVAELLLERWDRFLGDPNTSDQAFIIESYPYQSHLRVLWQMNAPEGLLAAWLEKLHKRLSSYQPILVMLQYEAPDAQTRQIFELRGPDWSQFIADFFTATPYGRAQGATGLDGTLTLLQHYNKALTEWSQAWPFTKVNLVAWSGSPEEQARKIASAIA